MDDDWPRNSIEAFLFSALRGEVRRGLLNVNFHEHGHALHSLTSGIPEESSWTGAGSVVRLVMLDSGLGSVAATDRLPHFFRSFPKGATPKWMDDFGENPTKIRMMTGGTPILGSLHLQETIEFNGEKHGFL